MAIARKAAVKDVPAVKELYFQLMLRFNRMDSFDRQDMAYWKNKSQSDFKKLLRKRDVLFLLLEENNKPIGFAELRIRKRHPSNAIKKTGHIESLFIKPNHRKKGYSKILLGDAMRWFKKKGMKHFTVNTHARDKKANSFWKKFGFKEYNIEYRI